MVSPFIPHKNVRGFVFEVETGKLPRWPDRPAARAFRVAPARHTGAVLSRRFATISVLAVVVALLGTGCTNRSTAGDDAGVGSAGAGAAEVVRVVDGDTIVVRLGGTEERVRLLGIDTPESVDPRSPVECFGKEAAAHTGSLLPPGTPVRLVRDVEARDRYDRLLAYVYRIDDGTFVNLRLVEDGYAAVLTYPPNVAHADEFVAAAGEARESGRGLWSAC